jgi:uncharacterized protein (DUF433 family)
MHEGETDVTGDWRDLVHSDPAILKGRPVLRGTRISVEFVLNLLSGGWSEADILRKYPHLSSAGVRAALGFAHDMLVTEDFVAAGMASNP